MVPRGQAGSLPGWGECRPAAARAPAPWFRSTVAVGGILGRGLRHGQKLAGAGEVFPADGAGEQAVMANAVKSPGQDMQQEAADELCRFERHHLMACGAIAAVILVAKGDAGLVEGEQSSVRNGDAVGIAREVGEHRFGTSEGRLGIDHPAFLADRREVSQEGPAVGEWSEAAEEGEPAGVVKGEQFGEEQAAEQLAEDAHRQEERWSRGDPALSIECDAATRHDHVHVGVVGQCRSPGVEHGGDADPRAQVSRIGPRSGPMPRRAVMRH